MLKFIAFFLLVMATSSLNATLQVDVRSIEASQPLKGPWAFAPMIVEDSNDSRLKQQSLMLPQFIDSYLTNPHDIVTLALTLKTTPNLPLSINMKQPYSVWKLYANEKLIGSSGEFNPKSGQHLAHANYPIIEFTPTNEQTHLLLYLANSQHQHIGFYGTPLIAPKGILEKYHLQASIIEKIVAVVLFLFGIYHIGLFLAWKKDTAPLWFGMACISLAVRTTTTGEKIITELLPEISWELLTRVEYVSGYITLPLFVLYVGSLYPKQKFMRVNYVYLFFGLLFACFALFSSTYFFTSSLTYYYIVVFTFIFYITWILLQSLFARETGSILALVAFFFFSATIVHDLLLFQNIIIFLPIDLMPYGFLVYLFAQAAILLLRYTNSYHLIEIHTNNLEYMIAQRTQELSAMVSQRELLLRELTHRVKNNLQFIISLLWIQRKEADPQTSLALKRVEAQVQSIAAVHETLCSQNSIDVIEVHDYIGKIVSSLERLYPDIGISLKADKKIYIKSDHAASLGLIINELITNHVKYSITENSPPIHIFIEDSIAGKSILHYCDGVDHRETFANAALSAFGLPKMGWTMIKSFIKQIDGEITPYAEHIELHFFTCECA